MELILIRSERNDWGTFGELIAPSKGGLFSALKTCEDDWRDNQRNISCIPAGRYRLVRTVYYKHNYETFEVTPVPNRHRILIHPGNTEEDTDGCILVGLRRGTLWVPDEDDPLHKLALKDAVVESQAAFATFMDWMRGVDDAYLVIRWGPGLP